MFAAIAHIYNLVIYIPLYNGLIGLMDLFPWMDAGVAIIVFTIIIRLILFPSRAATVKTQIRMREIQPEISELQKKINEQAGTVPENERRFTTKHIFDPFSSTLLISIIQLPILIALITIFSPLRPAGRERKYPLSCFIHIPIVNIVFSWILLISQRPTSSWLSSPRVTQFLQLRFSFASQASSTPNRQSSMRPCSKTDALFLACHDFFLRFPFPAAISLYWAIGNLFMLGQELFVRFHHEKGKQKAIGLN